MSAFHAFFSEWPYAVFLGVGGVSQYTGDVIVVPCCMNSTISTHSLSQETDAISFVADNICLNFFFGLFGECVCSHCFDFSLVTFTNVTQVSPSVTHTLRLRNLSPSVWYRSKNVKAEGSHSLHFVCTREHFQNPSCAKRVMIA
jgi:hypothetical protein